MEQERLNAAINREITYSSYPCRKCGSEERYTSNGACTHCSRLKSKSYRLQNKEILELARAAGRLEIVTVGDANEK